MSDLLEHVEETIAGRGLLRRRQAVLVAVSGGVDSMVLLHLLHKLSRKNSWRLTIAHLNHRLRGRSSDADERLVVRTARKLGLRVVVERAAVNQVARDQKLSVEMAARKVRHDFLARTAARLKIRTVALAHHADDQIELFFLRLFRGSGSEGLAGMKWRNPAPGNSRASGKDVFHREPNSSGEKWDAVERVPASRIELIRPLLDQPKAALAEFGAQHKIKFREDASNSSLDIQRNRIRHELLPLLRRDYQPGLDRTISRVMEIVGAEAEVVGELAASWLESLAAKISNAVEGRARHSETVAKLANSGFSPSPPSDGGEGRGEEALVDSRFPSPRSSPHSFLMGRGRKPKVLRQSHFVRAVSQQSGGGAQRTDAPYHAFAELPVAVQRRCIHLQLLRRKVAPDFDLVENLRTRPGHFIKVSPDLAVVQAGDGCLRFQPSPTTMAATNPAICKLDLKAARKFVVFNGVRFDWRIAPNPFTAQAGQECFDADRLGARIILRHWRAGDRFQPSGMRSPVKLQDLFVNGKIPREDRSRLIIAEKADGGIFWVERLRIGERFKLAKTTKRCLQWHWKRF